MIAGQLGDDIAAQPGGDSMAQAFVQQSSGGGCEDCYAEDGRSVVRLEHGTDFTGEAVGGGFQFKMSIREYPHLQRRGPKTGLPIVR